MNRIAAFVGHSFTKNDSEVVNGFLEFFHRVQDMDIGFTYDHAKPAEAKELSQKVKEKMADKNLFIGICTAKEQTIDPQKIKKAVLNKNNIVARQEDFEFKTSDWIIQEIGYAIGKEMDLMILLEKGLRRPGGLQGDIEYIPFNRLELEKTFNQLLEMLKSLMPKKGIAETGQVEKQPKDKKREEIKESEETEYIEISPDWNFLDYRVELFKAILRKDKDRADAISEAFFQSEHGKNEYKQIHWKGTQLFWRLTYTDEQTLNQLIDLSNKNPEHSGVYNLLGNAYSKFEKYDTAAEYYKQAATFAKRDALKLTYSCNAAVSLSKHGDKKNVNAVLEEAKKLKDISQDGNLTLMKTMSEISEIEANHINYVAFYESLLDQKPDDHENRFHLAYKYSDIGENDLALYHYKVLSKEKPEALVWNNLGAAQSDLELKSRAVQSYQKSIELDNTLAMSNIAYLLIDSGFLNEAEEICNNALKIENYDKRVASAISKIEKVRKTDEKREEDILEETIPGRKFYIEYANACTKEVLKDFKETYKGPECELYIKIETRKMEMTGSYEKEEFVNILALNYLRTGPLTSGATPQTSKKIMQIKYEGEVVGNSVKFSKRRYEAGKDTTLLTEPAVEARGLMIISDDLSTIKVLEGDDQKNRKFYEIKKMN